MNVLLELPTGCGKSLILNLYAHWLLTYTKTKKVIILVTSEYLAYQHQVFFSPIQEGTCIYPVTEGEIIYASTETFFYGPIVQFPAHTQLLLDEVDGIFEEDVWHFMPGSSADKKILQWRSKVLPQFKNIVAVTGTSGLSTKCMLEVDNIKFETIRIKPNKFAVTNKLE